MRTITRAAVIAMAALALALAGCTSTSTSDAPDAPEETQVSASSPTGAETFSTASPEEAVTSSAVPEGISPENFGCTSIELAEEGTTYSEPGCYFAPDELKFSFEGECGMTASFVEGGSVTRIKSCETVLDPDCVVVEEFVNGEYIPEQGPHGFFVTLEGAGCYYVPNHLSATAENEECLTEASAPDGWRRYEVVC